MRFRHGSAVGTPAVCCTPTKVKWPHLHMHKHGSATNPNGRHCHRHGHPSLPQHRCRQKWPRADQAKPPRASASSRSRPPKRPQIDCTRLSLHDPAARPPNVVADRLLLHGACQWVRAVDAVSGWCIPRLREAQRHGSAQVGTLSNAERAGHGSRARSALKLARGHERTGCFEPMMMP